MNAREHCKEYIMGNLMPIYENDAILREIPLFQFEAIVYAIVDSLKKIGWSYSNIINIFSEGNAATIMQAMERLKRKGMV